MYIISAYYQRTPSAYTVNVIARRTMSDVAISYYVRILSTYIVCRQRGDSHVTSFLGMTYIMTMYIISAYYQRTPTTSLRGGQCPTWQSPRCQCIISSLIVCAHSMRLPRHYVPRNDEHNRLILLVIKLLSTLPRLTNQHYQFRVRVVQQWR